MLVSNHKSLTMIGKGDYQAYRSFKATAESDRSAKQNKINNLYHSLINIVDSIQNNIVSHVNLT